MLMQTNRILTLLTSTSKVMETIRILNLVSQENPNFLAMDYYLTSSSPTSLTSFRRKE